MHELAYKLEVEKKVKLASQKMEQLGVSAKDENEESNEKIVLLKRALQKYQGLYIPGEGKLVKKFMTNPWGSCHKICSPMLKIQTFSRPYYNNVFVLYW